MVLRGLFPSSPVKKTAEPNVINFGVVLVAFGKIPETPDGGPLGAQNLAGQMCILMEPGNRGNSGHHQFPLTHLHLRTILPKQQK